MSGVSCPSRLKGCSRGIFALKSWEPLRRPGTVAAPAAKSFASQPKRSEPRPGSSNSQRSTESPSANGSSSTSSASAASDQPYAGCRILAKFNYTANPDTPLGKELSCQQKDKMLFVEVHQQNEHWWLAETDDGERGYIPASYMMVIEEKVTALPWLQNKKVEEVPVAATGTFKPYKSTYQHNGLREVESTSSTVSEFYCKVCDKQLNGPKPYSSHMASKGHREEMEELEASGRTLADL